MGLGMRNCETIKVMFWRSSVLVFTCLFRLVWLEEQVVIVVFYDNYLAKSHKFFCKCFLTELTKLGLYGNSLDRHGHWLRNVKLAISASFFFIYRTRLQYFC